ncbi:MAG: hypothetical protein WC107_04645 [Patescibacteria group bacterium]
MNEKDAVDWLAVEADYRPNKLSLRAIGEKYGCTEGAIRKRAKKEGWVRDLSEKIKSKADDLVRRELVRNSTQTEKGIVEANAHNSATIQINERKDVSRARSIAMSLLDELESQITDKSLYSDLAELLQSQDGGVLDKLNELFQKVTSFSGRTDNIKKLSETLKTLIDLERRVYKIDEDNSQDTFEDWLRKARNA